MPHSLLGQMLTF